MSIRELTTQLMVLGVFNLTLMSETGTLQAASLESQMKQRIQQFGVGTELKLKLKNGDNVRGAVESIADDGFAFTSEENSSTRQLAFNDLERASYPKRGYKTDDAPDAMAAKRMVIQLGVGEHIMVKVSPTQKIRGVIASIHDDHFAIAPDGESSTVDVPYTDIHKVNKNLSLGATIAIIAVIAATVVLVLVLTGHEDTLPNT